MPDAPLASPADYLAAAALSHEANRILASQGAAEVSGNLRPLSPGELLLVAGAARFNLIAAPHKEIGAFLLKEASSRPPNDARQPRPDDRRRHPRLDAPQPTGRDQ